MLVNRVSKAFDILQIPIIVQFVWHLLTGVSPLTEDGTEAVAQVLDSEAVRYSSVRVAQGRVLRLIFKLNKHRAITMFHTINLPLSGRHSRDNLDLLVHKMVHGYQFEQVGSIYIWEVLGAQRGEGYVYGGWRQLAVQRQNGQRFSGYNGISKGRSPKISITTNATTAGGQRGTASVPAVHRRP